MGVAIQTVELPSDVKCILEVEKILKDLSRRFDLKEATFADMLIGVSEAVNNAIVHGNKSNLSKKISLQILQVAEGISITITDEGKGFDYLSIPDPTLPENILNSRGRGVYIMHQLSHKVAYTNNGRTVQLFYKTP